MLFQNEMWGDLCLSLKYLTLTHSDGPVIWVQFGLACSLALFISTISKSPKLLSLVNLFFMWSQITSLLPLYVLRNFLWILGGWATELGSYKPACYDSQQCLSAELLSQYSHLFSWPALEVFLGCMARAAYFVFNLPFILTRPLLRTYERCVVWMSLINKLYNFVG